MKVVVIYQSTFGNTHVIAEAIAVALHEGNEVIVVPVSRAERNLLASASLILVGGLAHVHGMSRLSTREGAVRMAGRLGNQVTLDADAQGTGLREWFASVCELRRTAAAFDTRLEGLVAFARQASHAISRQLRSHGFVVIARPQSFLVTGSNQLRPGEEDRARRWGEQLGGKLAAAPTRAGHS
jgi:hypothetical protein